MTVPDLERLATPIREDRLVIAPSFEPGDVDGLAVDAPFLFSVDGRQGMTYVGWDGTGYQTAISWRDGADWSRGTPILRRDSAHPHRHTNAALTSIIRDEDLRSAGSLRRIDGWYVGTYHAYPGTGYEVGPAVIGFVRSRDLVDWEDVGGVLRAEDGAAWERGGLYRSWLMEHEGRFLLFYNAKDRPEWPWTEQIGLADSDDLRTWRRHPASPVLTVGGPGAIDERFASDPCVLRDGDRWVMAYFGLAADGHARDTVATSHDLVTWTRSGVPLLEVGSAGSIDALRAHKPSLITWAGRLEHWYCAVAPIPPIVIGGRTIIERRGIARATGWLADDGRGERP